MRIIDKRDKSIEFKLYFLRFYYNNDIVKTAKKQGGE